MVVRSRLLDLLAAEDAYVRLRPAVRFRTEFEDIVLNHRIWFGDVRSQDDVFEGNPIFGWREAATTMEELTELVKRQMPGSDQFQQVGHVLALAERLRDPKQLKDMRAMLESEIGGLYARSSILSFFRQVDRQSFWGQYADKGRGFAAVFDFKAPWLMPAYLDAPSIEMVPFPVEYVDAARRPVIELAHAPVDRDAAFEDTKNALLTKSNEWMHQQEARIIRVGINAGHQSFPAESLLAVVLGYAASSEDVAFALKAAGRRPTPIEVFQVELTSSYALGLRQLM